ncbi:hypothetical protein [Myroides odoratimimus]|uniref:hypothetical protein n=1 Tax=Myroides odoratimimus TaxID=76832 RepID=UPI0031010D44
MKDTINLKTRTDVLYFSLQIEESVNSLLQIYLQILDKQRTKNFGNKAGIPFKSKIDLLYDIEVLTKQEHSDLELLMNFRNKFLHDLDSDSFTRVLETIDNGIKNRFKKFLDSDVKIENEQSYINACSNLYYHNIKILKNKFREKRISLENKRDYMTGLYELIMSLTEISSEFATDIMLILENSELENPVILKALQPLIERCNQYSEERTQNQDFENLEKLREKIPKNKLY